MIARAHRWGGRSRFGVRWVSVVVAASMGLMIPSLPGVEESAVAREALEAPLQSAEQIPEVVSAVQPIQQPQAATLSGSEFNPGFIISDQLFYDGSAMTSDQIQGFLDSMIGVCTNGKCLNVAVLPVDDQPRRVSRDTGNVVCEFIRGGSLRASELIYRVQVACGISAKVILVTLQKEQGLVTSRAPSDYALRAAMGMACPDTAPCDAAFAGLARQIISGTGQLKVYKAGGFAKQPGVQFIQYHPNSECGGTTLNVANYATAALYSYTPYQPNAAALANLGGTGDSCSSYGNRNFWRYYNNWFGSTTAGGEGPGAVAINEAWATNGGRNGAWGNRLEYSACIIGFDCGHVFENVIAGWTFSTGVVTATGRMKDWVLSQGIERIGYPDSNEVVVTVNGGGSAQSFSRGLVNWGPTGPFVVSGGIRSEHGAIGGVGGVAGWPIAAMQCIGHACAQEFQNGIITSLAGSAASVVDPGMLAYYRDKGGPTGTLGLATSRAITVAGNGGGVQQAFTGGLVNRTPQGTFLIRSGAFRDAHAALGGVGGSAGWPLGDQVCGLTGGGCWQRFQAAVITSRDGVARSVAAPIAEYYVAKGGPNGSLGYPVTNTIAVPASWPNGGGTQVAFQGGLVESSAAGVFLVEGVIRNEHGRLGGVGGTLGWPTSEMTCGMDRGGCAQTFQGGIIFLRAGIARAITDSAIAEYFTEKGGVAGPLGYPLSPTVVVPSSWLNGGGAQVAFENGLVATSGSGTFLLTGHVREAHGRSGGVAGALGWPVAEQVCGSDGACTQQFQNGTIFVTAAGQTGAVTNAAISTYYQAEGGPTGSLGYPLSPTVVVPSSRPNGGGAQVAFENGLVETSVSGTFLLTGHVRETHGRLGGVAGALGWPVAEQVCGSDGGCSQQFQNGTIFVSASGVGQGITDSTMLAAYQGFGGPGGTLGYPISATVNVSANGGGTAQAFQNGLINSGPAGAFITSGVIRSLHAAAGGVGGSLGWPTGPITCDTSGLCTQPFQNGVLQGR